MLAKSAMLSGRYKYLAIHIHEAARQRARELAATPAFAQAQRQRKKVEVSPDLVFTDALGNRWNPRGLAKKTTFVTVWASWCGPCRAELPYVEKLYQHFRDRNDVVILAFNVDDDPKAMTTALQELKVSLPSIPARDFAYSIVPEMALPANWIITPGKTEMFTEDSSSHEAWLASAVTAIDKATGKSRSPTAPFK